MLKTNWKAEIISNWKNLEKAGIKISNPVIKTEILIISQINRFLYWSVVKIE